MAEVTITIGSEFRRTSNRLWWRGSNPLQDVSQLAPGARLRSRYFYQLVLYTDSTRNQLHFDPTSTHTTNADGEDLNTEWEDLVSSIILEAGGLKLEIPGPNHTSNDIRDNTERYSWSPSSSKRSEIGSFLTAYKSLSSAQLNATTLTLRDQLPIIAVDAGDANWNFHISESSVTKNLSREYAVDASDVNWRFALLQPSVLVSAFYADLNVRFSTRTTPLLRLKLGANPDDLAAVERVPDEEAVQIQIVHRNIRVNELKSIQSFVRNNRVRIITVDADDGVRYRCVFGSEEIAFRQVNPNRFDATVIAYGNPI